MRRRLIYIGTEKKKPTKKIYQVDKSSFSKERCELLPTSRVWFGLAITTDI